MNYFKIFLVIIVIYSIAGCNNEDPTKLSASATATRNASGEVVVRDSTQAELDSLDSFHQKLQKINKEYPAPPTPLNQISFAVRSITEDGVFILENNLQVKMSGIKCSSSGVHFLRQSFFEETERLTFLKEKELENGSIDSYVWVVDSSMMKDPDMKQYGIGPSFSGMNDIVILNNWCEIDADSSSIYLSRYIALDNISKNNIR